MAQVFGGGFQRNGVAEGGRRLDGAALVRCGQRRADPDAVVAEQRGGLRLGHGDPGAAGLKPGGDRFAAAQGLFDEGAGGALVDVVEFGDAGGLLGLGAAAAPLRVAHRVGEGVDGALGRRVGGDSPGAQPADQRGQGEVGEHQRLAEFPAAVGGVQQGLRDLRGVLDQFGRGLGAVHADRRDGDGDHRVHLRVAERGVQGDPEVLAAGAGGQVDGGARAQAGAQAGVVGEQAERVGVADDRDPAAGRQRLPGQQFAGVEEFGDGVHPDHAGLLEQGVHGGVAQPGGGGLDGVAGRQAAGVPGALEHHDGLGGGEPAGDPGELPRVAEGFEVEQHHAGGVVLLPVLEQVVAGDVAPVADRRERGDAGAAPVGGLQQGDADRAGLAEHAERSAFGQHGGERGVQPVLGVGVDQSEGVRADHPHAGGPGLPDQFALPVAPVRPGLGVPGGDHHQALHAVRAALGDGRRDGGLRHRDHGQVDRAGDRLHRAVARQPVQQGARVGAAVHRVHRAVEAGPEVAQQRPADRLRVARDADHGDRTGRQQPLHGPGFGAVLAGPHDGERGGGGLQVELQVHHAVGEAAPLGVAGVGEHLHHLPVLRQHFGGEPADAALLRDRRDVLQQRGGDAPALVGVLHQERHLGVRAGGGRHALLVDPVVPDGGDEPVPHHQGQADPVHVVVVREPAHVLVGQVRVRGEEAEVLRLVGDLLVELHQPVRVVRGDRSDPGRAAVAQQDVGLPVLRITVLGLFARRGVLDGVVLHGRQGSRRRA